MQLKWLITAILTMISSFLGILIALYQEEIRKILSSILNTTDTTIAFSGLVIIVFTCVIILFFYIGYLIFVSYKRIVTIQPNSLRFYKYPYLRCSKIITQQMSNMVYSTITIENHTKNKVEKCELEITLKGKKPYNSKVCSSYSGQTPNPLSISIDPDRTVGFHPLCLRLITLDAFLPNIQPQEPGALTGTSVLHDEYEINGKVIYDGKLGKNIIIGKIKIPDDFLQKAEIPNDIKDTLDRGGFAVYLELQGKIRAKFYGHNDDSDIKRIIRNNLYGQIPEFDNIIEDNGRLRKLNLTGGANHHFNIELTEIPEIQKNFDDMHKKLISLMTGTKFLNIFIASNFILSESLYCYKMGAYMGAAVLSRGAIDAAIYYLASRKNIAKDYYKPIGQMDFDFTVDQNLMGATP